MLTAFFQKPALTLVTLLATCLTFSNLWAANSPESIEGTTKVTAEEFIDLVEKIPGLVIIDSRIPGDRKQGFVEGSLSLPDVDTTCETLTKVQPKKGAPTLFYCNGVKCGRSAKAIKVALSCG